MKWNALWNESKIGAFAVGVWRGVGRAGPAAGGIDTKEKRGWGKKNVRRVLPGRGRGRRMKQRAAPWR